MWTITPNCIQIIIDALMVVGSPFFHRSGLALQVAGESDFKFGAGNRIQTEVFG